MTSMLGSVSLRRVALRAASAVGGSGAPHGARTAAVRAESTHAWKPALERGKLPVYDEALAFLEADAKQQRALLDAERAKPTTEEQKQRVDALSILSEINLPHVRQEFVEGGYDMRRPVFRHLREQAWRLGGSLAQLNERIAVMKVLPDVIPAITPTVDLQVAFGQGSGIGDHGGEGGDVLAGVFLEPAMTRTPPRVQATAFHEEVRKYTLMLVDPDAPNEDAQTFGTYVHWLLTDIPLSVGTTELGAANEALSYVSPHPQAGTPYHRYTMVLFEQSAEPVFAPAAREGLDVAQFARENGLTPAGIHFFRERWTEANKRQVSAIYAEELQVPEPRYGRVGRGDKLKDELGERHSRYY